MKRQLEKDLEELPIVTIDRPDTLLWEQRVSCKYVKKDAIFCGYIKSNQDLKEVKCKNMTNEGVCMYNRK